MPVEVALQRDRCVPLDDRGEVALEPLDDLRGVAPGRADALADAAQDARPERDDGLVARLADADDARRGEDAAGRVPVHVHRGHGAGLRVELAAHGEVRQRADLDARQGEPERPHLRAHLAARPHDREPRGARRRLRGGREGAEGARGLAAEPGDR